MNGFDHANGNKRKLKMGIPQKNKKTSGNPNL